MAIDVTRIQDALQQADIDGWLFADFRRSNPIAHRVLGLSSHTFFSRRWCYFVPRSGNPVGLVSAVESHVLGDLSGSRFVYHTWQEYQELVGRMLAGAQRIAMEYSPENAIPYVAFVDAGTVELVRRCGPQVVSSGDLAQQFEAVLSDAQIASHRTAGRALLRARDAGLSWLREQLELGEALTEYMVRQAFTRFMGAEGLEAPEEEQLAAVNGNAANPHYAPTRDRSDPVTRGDLLLLDCSAPLHAEGSVFADYTWMIFLGERVPDRASQFFDIIRQARDAGIALLRERFETNVRVEGYEIDDAVRSVIQRSGYGEAFIHRTGHNIGTAVHGLGAHLDNFETHDSRVLLPNTCTSVEPGLYLPNEGLGLRTEVDVLLLPGSVEVTGIPAQQEILPLLA